MESAKTLWRVVNFLAVYRLTQVYLYDFRAAIGPSMIPTFREAGDLLLVDKISPRFTGYKKGDIVIAKSPSKLNNLLCKRIIAVEGEVVEAGNNKYLVPQGHVWIEGDNKSQSFDSRDFGPILLDLLEGRILMKIWSSPKIFR